MEYEAKFQLPHFTEIRKRVLAHGGRLLQERMLERNLRFDDPEHTLSASHQVLRLRQDREITMTYKQGVENFESRIEVQLQVDDFDTARSFLESLGYNVIHEYEKYRESFTLGSTKIMLDELPFGCYVEIEADSLDLATEQALELGFVWDQRMQTSYLELFNQIRQNFDIDFDDATFHNFEQVDQETRQNISASLNKFHSQLE
jgi:adenylate cyclase class 2